MAKKTYKKYYRRKGRWAGNIRTITNEELEVTQGSFFGTIDLATNPAQVNTTVSQTYTVKNIELSYQLETENNEALAIEGLCAYIMYVPEGYAITETLPNLHPEWIMAYRWLGSPDIEVNLQPGRLPSFIKTRMSRRLQSGDKIILLINGTNESNQTRSIFFSGLIRWWTKAN